MKHEMPIDFLLSFSGEAISEHGEDNWCYVVSENTAMLGVFDGCGGSGARKRDEYAGNTEAYMASRFCSGVFYEHFMQQRIGNDLDELAAKLSERFSDNAPERKTGEIQLKGSMVRTLPTTAAAVTIRTENRSSLRVEPIWAGDSRIYVLDRTGLSQITRDDTTQADPMEGQYDDGVLTNVVCTGKRVRLNSESYQLQLPCIVIAATDGCFGYVSTPMEFEGLLLQALMTSNNPSEWEANLLGEISKIAGDDHTLILAAFGFGDFDKLKHTFAARLSELEDEYLSGIREMHIQDRHSRRELWQKYKMNYMKYLEGENV